MAEWVHACVEGVESRHHQRPKKVVPLEPNDWLWCARLICSALPEGAELLAPSTTQQCAEDICEGCVLAFGTPPDHLCVAEVIGPICQLHAEPSRFLAKTIMRSGLMDALIGTDLSKCLRESLHLQDIGGSAPTTTPTDLFDSVVRDLLDSKRQMLLLKRTHGGRHVVEEYGLDTTGMALLAPGVELKVDNAAFRKKISAILVGVMAAHNIRLNSLADNTFDAISHVFHLVTTEDSGAPDMFFRLCSERNARRYVNRIDEAIDLLRSEEIAAVIINRIYSPHPFCGLAFRAGSVRG